MHTHTHTSTGGVSLRYEVVVPGLGECVGHECLAPLQSEEHGVGTGSTGRGGNAGRGWGGRRDVRVGRRGSCGDKTDGSEYIVV